MREDTCTFLKPYLSISLARAKIKLSQTCPNLKYSILMHIIEAILPATNKTSNVMVKLSVIIAAFFLQEAGHQ